MRVPLLLGLAVAGGCNVAVSDAVPDVRVDESFVLAPGESVEIEGADLTVTFLEVRDDSRCPADVQCVWAGEVVLSAETIQAGVGETWQLHSGEQGGGSTRAELGSYRLELLGVAPEPRTQGDPIAPGEYRATFRVVAADQV